MDNGQKQGISLSSSLRLGKALSVGLQSMLLSRQQGVDEDSTSVQLAELLALRSYHLKRAKLVSVTTL